MLYLLHSHIMMSNRQILYMDTSQQDIISKQELMMLLRRIQLGLGFAIMLFIITSIICKKLYRYNTTKCFMFCCLCYMLGMAVVLPHNDSWTNDHRYYFDDKNSTLTNFSQDHSPILTDVLQDMKLNSGLTGCGLEAFFNLYFYDLGYFFAVLVTYNVFCVINNNYHNFMKNVLKKPIIILFLIFMFLAHLTPLILMFTHDQFNANNYAYSYGPSGFKYPFDSDPNLILYCGISFSQTFKYLAIGNIYICPLIMSIFHSIILCRNKRRINMFLGDQYLNAKQQFLIRSGRISFVVFIIQLINLGKLALTLLIFTQSFQWVIIIINFAFDLYPVVLLCFYFIFTKQRAGNLGASTLIEEDANQ